MTDTLIVHLPANVSISSREEQPTPLGESAFPDKNLMSVSTQPDSIVRGTHTQSQSQGHTPVSRGSTQQFPFAFVTSVSNGSSRSLRSVLDSNDSTTTHTVLQNNPLELSTTAVATPKATGNDWAHVPLITGPMYLIVNTVYVICDCTLTEKWLSIVPRDTSYSAIKIKVKKLIEFKMLNFLHYFDHYLLELVLQGDVDETFVSMNKSSSIGRASPTAILVPNASVRTVRPSVPCKFSEVNRLPKKETKPSKTRRSTLSASEALSPQTPLTVPEDVSPHPFRSRRSVSSKGHPGGTGYSIVTLKALDGERFFDWVEALEDVRDVSAMPLYTQPIVQPTEPHLRPEYPVFGQKFYALA